MNLAAMLGASVTPLAKIIVPPVKRTVKPPKVKGPDNVVRRTAAVEKYRAVMGSEWTPTWLIEQELGVGSGQCMPNLNKWLKHGIVERKKPCPDHEWAKYKGYLWRFVK